MHKLTPFFKPFFLSYFLLNINSFYEFKRQEITGHSILAVAHCVNSPSYLRVYYAVMKTMFVRSLSLSHLPHSHRVTTHCSKVKMKGRK